MIGETLALIIELFLIGMIQLLNLIFNLLIQKTNTITGHTQF